jgi:hypothetical protein
MSVGEEIFVGEDAIEGGAADGELAGGAEFVAAVEVEDEVDMLANDGVKREIGDACGLRVKHECAAGGGVGPLIENGIELRMEIGIEGWVECWTHEGIGRGIAERVGSGADAEGQVE